MGTIKLFIVFILLFSTGALADDLLDNSLGDNGEEDSLKYNTFENKWDYAGEDDSLKYNALENEWDYAGDDDSLKYNTFENKWEYADWLSDTRKITNDWNTKKYMLSLKP
jgi:hypothetical protein